MRRVMIHSDGYGGSGSIILDDDGKVIENVYAVDLHIEAGHVNVATVQMQMMHVNSEATVEGFEFTCPLCGWQSTHQCDQIIGT